MPSHPSAQACSKMTLPSAAKYLLSAMPGCERRRSRDIVARGGIESRQRRAKMFAENHEPFFNAIDPTRTLLPIETPALARHQAPDWRQVTESNPKVGFSSDSQGTSGRGSGLVKPLRFGISTLGSEMASRTVSSVTMLFR